MSGTFVQDVRSNAPNLCHPQDIVTVLVAKDASKSKDKTALRSFPLYKSVLCRQSPFFKAAFKGPFIEGQSQSMTLEDVGIEEFGSFVHWMHYGVIASKHGVESGDVPLIPTKVLIKLWMLGERFLVPQLQNDAMDMLYKPGIKICSSGMLNDTVLEAMEPEMTKDLIKGLKAIQDDRALVSMPPKEKYYVKLIERPTRKAFTMPEEDSEEDDDISDDVQQEAIDNMNEAFDRHQSSENLAARSPRQAGSSSSKPTFGDRPSTAASTSISGAQSSTSPTPSRQSMFTLQTVMLLGSSNSNSIVFGKPPAPSLRPSLFFGQRASSTSSSSRGTLVLGAPSPSPQASLYARNRGPNPYLTESGKARYSPRNYDIDIDETLPEFNH